MDRTSRIGLLICLVLLFALAFLFPAPPPKPVPPAAASTNSPTATAPPPQLTAQTASPTMAPAPSVPVVEKLTVIENDAIKVTFTSVGAAIKEVELKLHKADNGGHVVLNEQAHANVLSLSGWPGADTANFQVEEIPNGVRYSCDLPGGVKWVRTYTFGKNLERDSGMTGYLRVLFHKIARHLGQPETQPLVYTLDVSDTLTNTSAADLTLPGYSLSVGRAEPLYNPITLWSKERSASSSNLQYLGSGWLASKFHLTTINDFNPGYIPLIGIKTRDGKDEFSSKTLDQAPLRWIGVENQFFAMLLTPAAELPIDHGEFWCFNNRNPDNGEILRTEDPDIEAAAYFSPVTVPAGQSVTLTYGIYAGPKDFNRLDALGANQGELMNYGWFELLIVPMLTVLHFWYLIFHNYGVAIILLTLMIKAITWPLQSIANRSGKRMQALAPKLKEMQAKFKDQPEKLQTETFALYREYGVNPFGGCLPALIQMPVFFSLYFMLQNAVELRGQSFLWVHDLTKPDTVLTLPFLFFGFHPALHPLPIMVTALTMVMMRMTPQIGDPQQAKIAQFMPIVFLVIFYNFAAALSLYYVINNCVSIIQIYRNLRKPLPELKRVPRKKTK
ncbi:MAG: membrane protein insertase YidC [Methylacidiphilales bacterium]|nr:membrane protein insertase YidC [Candidatus Methylacidiphilales bacterium]